MFTHFCQFWDSSSICVDPGLIDLTLVLLGELPSIISGEQVGRELMNSAFIGLRKCLFCFHRENGFPSSSPCSRASFPGPWGLALPWLGFCPIAEWGPRSRRDSCLCTAENAVSLLPCPDLSWKYLIKAHRKKLVSGRRPPGAQKCQGPWAVRVSSPALTWPHFTVCNTRNWLAQSSRGQRSEMERWAELSSPQMPQDRFQCVSSSSS